MRWTAMLVVVICAAFAAGCQTTGSDPDGLNGEVAGSERDRVLAGDNALPAGQEGEVAEEQITDQPLPIGPSSPNEQSASPAPAEPADANAARSLIAGGALDYRLNPLDVIDVSVFQVPELSATTPINASGQISLPLIGGVAAAGKTTRELERDLETRLGERYLQSPQVTVFVSEYNSQQATVYGAVGSQGTVTVRGGTTLMQVLAQSGGLTRVADPSGIIVFRTIGGERQAAGFDMRAIERGGAEDPEILAGDIVVVDESALRSTWRDFREILSAGGAFRSVAWLF